MPRLTSVNTESFRQHYCGPTALSACLNCPIEVVEHVAEKYVREREGPRFWYVRGMSAMEMRDVVRELSGENALYCAFGDPKIGRKFLLEERHKWDCWDKKIILTMGGASPHAIAVYKDTAVDTLSDGEVVHPSELRQTRREAVGFLTMPAKTVADPEKVRKISEKIRRMK